MNDHPAADANHEPAEPLQGLRLAVRSGAAGLLGGSAEEAGEGRRFTLERPRRAEFGDYSTNAALVLAPELKAPPREVAERLGGSLAGVLGASLERFEVAGPGFLNLFLSDDWVRG